VVNCTGPACDLTRTDDDLLRSLFRDDVARPDALRLGLDVGEDGSVAGAAADRLFAVGPLTKGRWWEVTAVPDIRRQCQALAAAIAGRLAERAVGMEGPGKVSVRQSDRETVFEMIGHR
jgi:uncharacterized NAD(P)/FAD-binding protein YdhS